MKIDCNWFILVLIAAFLVTEKKLSEGASGPKKRRQRTAKARKTRTSQSSVSKDGDDSWEDLSSEEEVSVVADLPGPSTAPLDTSRGQDASSGPESLDPVPSANKEEELLWEEFHPAGFQNNMTLAMVTETAYKALLSKGETTENGELRQSESDPSDVPTFSADKTEENTPSLDPILVVTQIVKAEVDCMSLTSLTTDSSLPEDINVVPQSETRPEPPKQLLNAEELSGPVSILEIAPQKGETSSNSESSLQLADRPKSQIVSDDVEKKESSAVDPSLEADDNRTEEEKPQSDRTEESESVADGEKAEKVDRDLKSEQGDTNADEREETETLKNRSSEESETVNGERRKKDASESHENSGDKSCGDESAASDLDAKVENEEACQPSNGDKDEGATKKLEEAIDKETNADPNCVTAPQPSEMNR